MLISLVSQTVLLAQAPTTQAKAIDIKATYRLANDYTGPHKFLTVSEDDIQFFNMVDASRSPKQLWKFVPENDGKFRVVNMSDDEKYLDVTKRSDVYAVVMAEPGSYRADVEFRHAERRKAPLVEHLRWG